MKVTLERSALLKALGHVHRVVERRNTIPVLSNVLLRAEGNNLHFQATDLDLEVIEQVEATIETAGATTVPAHTLYDIVRKLSDGSQVTLEQAADGGGSVTVSSGRSRFTLQTLPEADFPNLTAGELPISFEVGSAELKYLIEKTQFAISTEETRYYLNGIYLHTLDVDGLTMLRAVATDGHRLARVELPAPSGSETMSGVIVPRKTVSEVLRLLENPDGIVKIALSSSKIRFTLDGIVLTSKLIDGTFPDYSRVIPANNDKQLVVEKNIFVAAVDRVATISSDRGRAVKLALSDGRLVLSVTNPDSGSATEELEVDYIADALEIGFNARYLLDIAAQIDAEAIVFKLADAGSPTLVQDQTGSSALFVLMPMRV